MKKMTCICTGLLLLLSSSIFAEEHLTEALEHANAAVVHGEAGDTAILIGHAKAACSSAKTEVLKRSNKPTYMDIIFFIMFFPLMFILVAHIMLSKKDIHLSF
jgi:Small metal-binding protein